MLTEELRRDIDNKWDACWPIDTLRPLALIDCICYLLFFKKLNDEKLIAPNNYQAKNGQVFYPNDSKELSWEQLEALEPKQAHALFFKENGIEALLKNYGRADFRYSQFLRVPLLIHPSPVLLSKVVEIVKIIEVQTAIVKGDIFDYLLHKTDIQSESGKLFAPPDVVHAMISLVKPKYGEVILDPSCGNGDLLVKASASMSHTASVQTNVQFSENVKGLDNDYVELRIAAMNLILHGIEDPALKNSEDNIEGKFPGSPDIIISNLFFINPDSNSTYPTPLASETIRKDVDLLQLILNNMQEGARAAIIIRDYILDNNFITDLTTIRQRLLNDFKIDAIITFPGQSESQFSSASLLMFHLSGTNVNDKVWFYKMKAWQDTTSQGPGVIKTSIAQQAGGNEELSARDIEEKFVNGQQDTGKIIFSENFFVTEEEIINNNYNLFLPHYKKPNLASEKFPIVEKDLGKKELAEPHFTRKIQKAAALWHQVRPNLLPLNKLIVTVLVPLLVLVFCAISLFFASKSPEKAVIGEVVKDNNIYKALAGKEGNASAKTQLTPAQIKKIINDTSGIIHYKNTNDNKDISGYLSDEPTSNNKVNEKKTKKSAPLLTGNSKIKYIVIDTTYFHNKPDKNTVRKSYLDPLKKTILTPLKESNGYIYVAYTNEFNRTSKGWINKKDLREVR